METIMTIFLLFVIWSCGYLIGWRSKQEREWLRGYRDGLKDAGFNIAAIIEKYSK